jgi:phage N-6-adenine-methyltransferase
MAVAPGFDLVRGAGGLEHYDPDKGLRAVAVAEAAEKHFQRARDATRLLEAVELKLAEQRRFVLWWDGQEKNPGNRGAGRGGHRPSWTDDGLIAGQDGLPDRDTIHRWRVRLKDDKKFDATLAAAQARCIKVCEARAGHADYGRLANTGEVEWYTPAEYVEAVRDVLGAIDLDPASSEAAQRTVRAARFFTKEDDGLAHPWPGRVWVNPPYVQPLIMHFVAKLVEEVAARRTTEAILLTHNFTDNAWFHLAASACTAICFTRGRIAFEHRDGYTAAPTQGQAFFYFGVRLGAFWTRFAGIGTIMAPLPVKRLGDGPGPLA